MGGVPNRGGLRPKDSLSADDKADSPGPGRDPWVVLRPANGVWVVEASSEVSWFGVGIWRTAGDPACGTDGTGESSRAVDCARDTLPGAGELRPEALDDEGTA